MSNYYAFKLLKSLLRSLNGIVKRIWGGSDVSKIDVWFSMLICSQKHQFEQLSINENTSTKAKYSSWGITAAGLNTEIKKCIEMGRKHRFPWPLASLPQAHATQFRERCPSCGERKIRWVPHFTTDPNSRPTPVQGRPSQPQSPGPLQLSLVPGQPPQSQDQGPPPQIQAPDLPYRLTHQAFTADPGIMLTHLLTREQTCLPKDSSSKSLHRNYETAHPESLNGGFLCVFQKQDYFCCVRGILRSLWSRVNKKKMRN